MATVKFYLKDYITNGQVRKDECSIVARFTVDRSKRFQINLKEKIQPKYWDFKGQQVKPTYRGHYELNILLSDFKTKLLTLSREHRELPFDKFKELVISSEQRNQKKNLFLAYEQFLQAYSNEKDSKTLAKFLTLGRQLEAFDKIYPFDFSTLDFKFYDRFKSFLYQIPNPFYKNYRLIKNGDIWDIVEGDKGDQVGIFDDQVFAYIIQTKTFLAWAEKRGHVINPSYKSWKILKRKHTPIALTMQELEKLQNHVYKSRAEDVARDYLVLECLIGQRISDIKRFNLKDFSNDKWTFSPKKGNRLSPKQVTVHFKGFCAAALDILHKYNWKLPVISDQKLNENIKKACKSAGIDSRIDFIRWAQNKQIRYGGPKWEFISSHSGRRTFITLSLQAGMPVEFVMALTGITEYKTIRHYRGKFEDMAIEQELEKMPTSSVMKKVS